MTTNYGWEETASIKSCCCGTDSFQYLPCQGLYPWHGRLVPPKSRGQPQVPPLVVEAELGSSCRHHCWCQWQGQSWWAPAGANISIGSGAGAGKLPQVLAVAAALSGEHVPPHNSPTRCLWSLMAWWNHKSFLQQAIGKSCAGPGKNEKYGIALCNKLPLDQDRIYKWTQDIKPQTWCLSLDSLTCFGHIYLVHHIKKGSLSLNWVCFWRWNRIPHTGSGMLSSTGQALKLWTPPTSP